MGGTQIWNRAPKTGGAADPPLPRKGCWVVDSRTAPCVCPLIFVVWFVELFGPRSAVLGDLSRILWVPGTMWCPGVQLSLWSLSFSTLGHARRGAPEGALAPPWVFMAQLAGDFLTGQELGSVTETSRLGV